METKDENIKVSQKMLDSTIFPKDWWGTDAVSLGLVEGDTVLPSNLRKFKGLLKMIVRSFTDYSPFIQITDSISSASYDGKTMQLSAAMFSEPISEEEQSKAFIGQFVHELGHFVITNPEMFNLAKKFGLYSQKTVGGKMVYEIDAVKFANKYGEKVMAISNILEDKRMEQKVAGRFPGYKKYLEASRKLFQCEGLITSKDMRVKHILLTNVEAYFDFYLSSKVLYPLTFESASMKAIFSFRKELNEKIDAILGNIDTMFQWSYYKVMQKSEELYALLMSEISKEKEERTSTSSLKGKGSKGNSSEGSSSKSDKPEGPEKEDSDKNEGDKQEEEINPDLEEILNVDSSEFEMDIYSLNSSTGEKSGVSKEQLEKMVIDAVQEAKEDAKEAKKKESPASAPKPESEVSVHRDFIRHESWGGVDYTKVEVRRVEPFAFNEDIRKEITNLSRKFQVDLKTMTSSLMKTKTFYMQEEGDFDEDEVANVRFSRDVFMDELPAEDYSLDVILLLDCSGSMSSYRSIEKQRIISCALADAFSKYPQVNLQVYGHTANGYGAAKLIILDFNDKRRLLDTIFAQRPMSNNADGYAMQYVAEKFNPKAAEKLLIMISDGQPSAVGYGGPKAERHVRNVVEDLKKKKIHVLSVAISNFNQSSMYDDLIPYDGHDTAKKLNAWLRKKLGSVGMRASF